MYADYMKDKSLFWSSITKKWNAVYPSQFADLCGLIYCSPIYILLDE